MSLSSLEKALHSYTLGQTDQPFDLKTVPVAPVDEDKPTKSADTSMSKPTDKPTATRHDVFVDRLAAVPAIAALNLGPLFRSTKPAELTESETEYVVQVRFEVIVLQFNVYFILK